jgi:hypothetical protein
VRRQANPKGLDLRLASDCPGRAFSRSGGKFASLAAGHRAGDRVGPERSHADRRSTSTSTASSRVGSYPQEPPRTRSRRACPSTRCQASGEATPCQRSVGVGTSGAPSPSPSPSVLRHFLYGFKGAPAARQPSGLRPDRPRGIAKPRGERVDLDAMTARARAGTAGDAPYSGAALGRDLRCGSPPVAARRRSAPPHPQAGGSAGNAPGGPAARAGPGRPPRAGHPVTAQRSQSRALAALTSLPRWRYAPPLSVIFPGKTSAPIRRTGGGP